MFEPIVVRITGMGTAMQGRISSEDVELVIESLGHYKMHIENYHVYPSHQFKQQQISRVEAVIAKMKDLRNDLARHS
jgi:hypothetical protein